MGKANITVGTQFSIAAQKGVILAKNNKKNKFKPYPHCNISDIKHSDIFLAKLSTGLICLVYRQHIKIL